MAVLIKGNEKMHLCSGCNSGGGGLAGLHPQPLGSFLLSVAHRVALILFALILVTFCAPRTCKMSQLQSKVLSHLQSF